MNSTTPESNNTHQEVVAIRRELQRIQNNNLKNVCEQIKELNEQNALLIREVTLLRKNMGDQVAKGVVVGSIFLAIVMGALTMCASLA